MNDKLLLNEKRKTLLTYLCSFFLPAFIMLFAFLPIGVFWGGPKSTLLVDGKLQYVSFFSDYARQLKNFDPPFFSRFFGPGLSFFGTWAYYLSSPVNLILVLFPESRLLDAIYLITLIKIGLCGLSFNVFVQRGLRIRNLSSLMFSTAYALCGTVIYNADNLQWLDGIIWLPILVLGIERIYERGRCAYLPFVLTILIVSNFYSAVLCAPFCVLYVIYVMVRSSRDGFVGKRGVFFIRVLSSAFLGVGMAAIVLVPAYYSLHSDMNLIGQSFPKLERSANPLISIAEMTFARKGYIYYEGHPKIYSGLLALVLIPLFARAKSIPGRYKWLSFGFLMLLFVVFHVSSLNFLFHGLDYVSWYPFRYAFIFSFLLIKMGAEGYRDGGFRYGQNKKYFIIILTGFVVFYMLPIGLYGLPDNRIISLVIFLMNMFFIIFYVVLLDKKKRVPLFLLLVLAVELFFNTAYIEKNVDEYAHYSSYNDWINRSDQIRRIAAENESGDGVDRIALRTDTLSANDPALLGIEGIDYFSSMGKSGMTHTLQKMGYIQYISHICDVSDNGGTILSDALLSISGEIVENSPVGRTPYLPSLFPSRHLTVRDSAYEPIFIKHQVALPRAFCVNDDILKFDSEQARSGPMEYNDQLLSHMLGHPVNTSAELSAVAGFVNATLHTAPGGWDVYIPEDPNQYSSITIEITGQGERVPIYLYCELVIKEDPNNDSDISLNVENEGGSFCVKAYDPTDSVVFLSIGAYPEGSPVRVTIPFIYCAPAFRYLRFFSQSEAEVQRAVAPLLDDPVDFRWTDPDSFCLKSRSETPQIIFISIPHDSGWHAEIDGKPEEILNLAGGFMGIRVPAGEHETDFSFFPEGLRAGFVISAFFLVATAAWLLVRRHKHSDLGGKAEKQQTEKK
ncbi:MAG: YfhO family protein [Oscillospiraceae bacterium]|nr:YfhO family protein [Oscillospiraceae bacterium]